MSFAREDKKLNQQQVFNPPPGYYQAPVGGQAKQASSFGHSQRFGKHEKGRVPGPGAYHNNQKEVVKKRLIEESQKREGKGPEGSHGNGIKISSIPSIPKKSATRVYEELAPGILILHEQEYQSSSIGPGSYNITDKMTHHKPISHKIAPEHPPKRKNDEQAVEINVPTMAQQIRNEKRLMYKQNIVKSSTVNKSEINPSDLCLEVIILREKLLRSDQNPPPGYYNTDNFSDFKSIEEKKAENVSFGKEKRLEVGPIKAVDQVGPGAYTFEEEGEKKGGFIPKQARKLDSKIDNVKVQDKPGPGAYITIKPKPKQDIKGNYPPIFGSGIHRFPSAPKKMEGTSPGPGSYQIDKKKFKKQKYIKIRKQLIEPTREEISVEPISGFHNDLSHLSHAGSVKQRKLVQYQKNSSNFASNVRRFDSDKSMNERIGPGNYDGSDTSFAYKSYNRKTNDYVGNRMARFDHTEVRPKLGPGVYNPGYETVKQKKIKNVFL